MEPTAAAELAELIVSRRTALGITQAELADTVGVTHGYIGHLEKQRRPVSPEVAQRLAEALDLDCAAVRRLDRIRVQMRVDAVRRTYESALADLEEMQRRERI